MLARSLDLNDDPDDLTVYKHLTFHKSILQRETLKTLAKDEGHVFFCGKVAKENDDIYVLPKRKRLRHVIHEIGHLMVHYGILKGKGRKLVRVDNFLYEILFDENLYDNPVACFYKKDNIEFKQKCENIKSMYETLKETSESKNGLTYPTFYTLLDAKT